MPCSWLDIQQSFVLSLLMTAKKKKLLWLKWTAAPLICGHKHSYLEGSLMGTSWLFRETVSVASPKALTKCTWIPSCEAVSSPVRKHLVVPIDLTLLPQWAHPALVLRHTRTTDKWDCWWQFSPSSLCHRSSTVKASQHRQRIQPSPRILFMSCSWGVWDLQQ